MRARAEKRVEKLNGAAVRVAVFTGDGAPQADAESLLGVCAATNRIAGAIGPGEVQRGVLSSFAAVVFPGGSGSAQARSLGIEGRRKVREFVGAGGGYLGICGGAFLSTSHYAWSLGILNATVLTSSLGPSKDPTRGLWYRGSRTPVLIELTSEAVTMLGHTGDSRIPVQYHNGPILSHGSLNTVARFKALAHYRSEVWKTENQCGTMINTPAIAAGSFGVGHVLVIGPHLEADPSQHPLLVQALTWLCREAT
jgi:glutamine amidotransferase-like uncharacterized protein